MRNQETNSRHASNAIPPADYKSHDIRAQAGMAQPGIAGMASLQAANEACRAREIPEKIARLFDRTELLSMHLAKFSARLEPVLMQQPAGTEEKTSAVYGSQLGGQLAELTSRIELMIDAVDALESQLQL